MNPSTYTDLIAEEICQRLAKGETLTSICGDEHMPARRTVSDWRRAQPEFDKAFTEAREAGFDALAEDCLSIADDASDDFRMGEKSVLADTDHIQRSKLRVWTRLQLLSKWDPKRYGERLDLNHSGSIQTVSDEQLKTRYEELIARAKEGGSK